MEVYGNRAQVSNAVLKYVDDLIKKYKEEEGIIYIGWPVIENTITGEKTVFEAIIVYGLNILYLENETTRKQRTTLFQKMSSNDRLAGLLMDGKITITGIKLDQQLFELPTCEKYSTEDFRLINAIIQNAQSLNLTESRSIKNEKSIGSMIQARSEKINTYDKDQFNLIYNPIQSHIRIRGLAGSGKTIVLAKKMAYLHYKNPDLKLAYVFYTKSLKQYITKLFNNFYREFAQKDFQEDDNVSILYCWGSQKEEGFYSKICNARDIEMITYRDTFPVNDRYGYVCEDVLNRIKNEKLGLFDYVFVDEAQDFSLPFFRLALHTLTSEGKLIYAYDELQNLNESTRIPSRKEIFGEEEVSDENLTICYRTPKEILVSAHALGMGIYSSVDSNKNQMCNIPEDLSIWKATGYESNSITEYGKQVDFFRNPSQIDSKIQEPVVFFVSSDEKERIKFIAKEMHRLINEEDILPEDILIIDLDSLSVTENFYGFKENLYPLLNQYKGKRENRDFELNLVSKDNPYTFKRNGRVSYSTIYRAKGNEANIVFILNAEKLNSLKSVNRNSLFTALTRTRFKAYIVGSDALSPFENEYKEVQNHNYHLVFKYPTKDELKHMKTTAATEKKQAEKIESAIVSGQQLKEDNIEAFKEMMMRQAGCNTIDELIEFLENAKKR